jgi:peptide/nickel transport system ATP-binding protein
MTEPAPVFAASGLTAMLGAGGRRLTVLDGIDLTINRGETLALLGESGSGKSTLGLAALGLLEPADAWRIGGSLRVAGEEVVAAAPNTMRRLRREKIGMVFQDPIGSLNPTTRIGRQLHEAIGHGASATDAEAWLKRVGIADAAAKLRGYPHQLSGGQCQRVMIAMALARNPALVIADEPTTALDMVVQAQILDLLKRLAREQGVAMLFVTHDLAVAASIADRIAIMLAGRLVEHGSATALLAKPAHPYTRALLQARFTLHADRTRMLRTLGADTQAASGVRMGCGFAVRCARALPGCGEAAPGLLPAAHGGAAACFNPHTSEDARQDQAPSWPAVTPQPARALLELVGIQKTFPIARTRPFARASVFKALENIDFRMQEGEAVALVGASGSGKSTLLRIVAGLEKPDSGDIAYLGRDRPQVVFQDAAASLTPWLTIGEQISERLRPMALDTAARNARVAEALTDVGLDSGFATARPGGLSGGQCQRAALARAIVVPPRLLLCDEAVSAMDVSLAAGILNLIGVLRRRLGLALLFVTHDLAAARFVADRMVVMAQGRLVEQGPVEQIMAHPAHPATRQLLAAMPGLAQHEAA